MGRKTSSVDATGTGTTSDSAITSSMETAAGEPLVWLTIDCGSRAASRSSCSSGALAPNPRLARGCC
jgi:hypothetical protein